MNNSVKGKSRQGQSDLKIMDKSKNNIVLFNPYMPKKAKKNRNFFLEQAHNTFFQMRLF